MFLYFKSLRFGPEACADLVGKIAALLLAVSIGMLTHSYWAIAVGTIAAPLFSTSPPMSSAPTGPC
jgi:PST family polysaccharide transporter